MRTPHLVALSVGALAIAAPARAQARPVTRREAIEAALARGPRLAVAVADSAAAAASVAVARQFENPSLALDYTRSTPRQHVAIQVPLWLPAQRTLGIRSAGALLDAAFLRTRYEREAVAFDADTNYTAALVARERARLSAHSATDADSLVTIARLRLDAGDASELDVQLAVLSAGQFANAAALDSLQAASTLLALQAAMGLSSRDAAIVLADSLDGDVALEDVSAGTPLLVAAAEDAVRASDLALSREHKRRFGAPSLALGFERLEPGGSGNRPLPTVGLSMPFPLFNRNQAAIMAAEALRDRTTAELALVRVEATTALALAERERTVARTRLERAQALVGAADRVAALSLLAYREGASSLPTVLESQRSARDTRTQYVEAIGALRTATARLRLLALASNRPS